MSERQQGLANRISEVKLQRIEELNARLRDILERERVSAKSACESYVWCFRKYGQWWPQKVWQSCNMTLLQVYQFNYRLN